MSTTGQRGVRRLTGTPASWFRLGASKAWVTIGNVSLASLAGELSGEEMSHLTAICQKPESAQNGGRALADYIRVIQTESRKRSGNGMDPLLAAAEKYKDKKGDTRNV